MGKSQLIHNNEFHLISKAEIRKATGKLVESLNLAAGSTDGFDIHIGIRQTKRALSLFTASRYKSSVCRTGNYIGNDICNVSVYIKRNYTDT